MIALIQGSIGRLACDALSLFGLILFARVVVDWIVFAGGRPPSIGPLRTAMDLLVKLTEPVLAPLRKIVPPVGMFDVSVMVAFAVIIVLKLAIC
jgi:YggT family protein